MDVAQFALQRAHHRADIIYLLPLLGIKEREYEAYGTPIRAYTNSVPYPHSLYPGGLQMCVVLGARYCSICQGISPKAQSLKKSVFLLHLIDDKTPPTARHSSAVACAQN